VLPASPAATTTKIEDFDGGSPGGCCRHVRQQPPPKFETSMAGPLGVLPAGPAAATTKIEDINGGAPGGCYRHVRQRPPPKLETSMVAPLGGAAGMSCSGHHQSWRRQWQTLWGLLAAGPTAATTEVGDIDGGPPRGCWRQGRQRPPLKLETSMATP
jgi:hypothetical protein